MFFGCGEFHKDMPIFVLGLQKSPEWARTLKNPVVQVYCIIKNVRRYLRRPGYHIHIRYRVDINTCLLYTSQSPRD